MKIYTEILKSEFIHLIKTPFKAISVILYIIAIIYGCQNGYSIFKKQNFEIKSIKENLKKTIDKKFIEYDEIDEGLKEKPRRDPTTPYWAVRNTSTYAFKYPSPLMVFSIGQSEQYGYYKRVTNWSTIFDSDLAAEIANPERLAISTLDFSFVLLYLTPILLIILLFNISGLEKDLGFINLVFLSNVSKNKWLFSRFLFYFILINFLLLSIMVSYLIVSGSFINELIQFVNLYFLIFIYILFWFCIFYFINISISGSSVQALKMITTYIALCVIIPGFIHQLSSIKYPTNYMVDYLNVNREQSNDIFELTPDSLRLKLKEHFPFLKNTIYGRDTTLNQNIINYSLSGLINILNKDIASKIEKQNEDKNLFINSFNKINPIVFYQNKINSLASTDYYSYKIYRQKIQTIIDNQIYLILTDTWNRVTVNKDKYVQYIESFN